jgi:hypothetical protein
MNDFLRGQPESTWFLGTVKSGVQHRIEAEFYAMLFSERFDLKQFFLVQSHGHGFQSQRDRTVNEQIDSPEALSEGSGRSRDFFIRFLGHAIQGDFDRMRPPLAQMLSDL